MKTPERALPAGLERHLRRLEDEYRRRLLLRGLLRLGALALVLALGGWVLLGQVQPGGGIFWGAAVAGTGLLLVGGWMWVWGPARARLDRRRLALLLDERLPQLENLALSSVDFRRADFSPDSDWLIEKLLRGADADFVIR